MARKSSYIAMKEGLVPRTPITYLQETSLTIPIPKCQISELPLHEAVWGIPQKITQGTDGLINRQPLTLGGKEIVVVTKDLSHYQIFKSSAFATYPWQGEVIQKHLFRPRELFRQLATLKRLKNAGVEMVDYYPKPLRWQILMEDLTKNEDPNIRVIDFKDSKSFASASLAPEQKSKVAVEVGKNLASIHRAGLVGRSGAKLGSLTGDLFTIILDESSGEIRVVVCDVGGVRKLRPKYNDHGFKLDATKRMLYDIAETSEILESHLATDQWEEKARVMQSFLRGYLSHCPCPALFEKIKGHPYYPKDELTTNAFNQLVACALHSDELRNDL